VPRHVDAQSINLEPVEGLLSLSMNAPKDGSQTKRELAWAVGLRHEIIRPKLEREDAVDFAILTGNQDDGLAPSLGSLPDPFEDIGRAHVG
jgi:hypothetical protein